MVKCSQQRGFSVLAPQGDINHAEMVQIKNAISAQLMSGRSRVVLDLSAVGHLNYMTLGVLVERAGRLRRSGGGLHFAGVSEYLHQILRFSGVDDLFELFETVEEASAAHAVALGNPSTEFLASAREPRVHQMN